MRRQRGRRAAATHAAPTAVASPTAPTAVAAPEAEAAGRGAADEKGEGATHLAPALKQRTPRLGRVRVFGFGLGFGLGFG